MRDGATGGSAAQIQREVLSGRDALHPLRSRDRVHVSLGSGLQSVDQAERAHLLEYAQLYFDLNGGLRLRAQKGRPGLEKMIAEGAADRHIHSRDSHLRVPLEAPNSFSLNDSPYRSLQTQARGYARPRGGDDDERADAALENSRGFEHQMRQAG